MALIGVWWALGCDPGSSQPSRNECPPKGAAFVSHPAWEAFVAQSQGQGRVGNACLQMAWDTGAAWEATSRLVHLGVDGSLSAPGASTSPFVGLSLPAQARRFRFRIFAFSAAQDRQRLCEEAMKAAQYACLQRPKECWFALELRLPPEVFRGETVAIEGREELYCRPYFPKAPEPSAQEPALDAAEPASEPPPEPPLPEGAECRPGARRSCYGGLDIYRGKGRCKEGFQLCRTDWFWGECKDWEKPTAESCNGIDDDCDGQTDEDFPERHQLCTIPGGAPCRSNRYVCVQGKLSCPARQPQPKELCSNGLDDDCDGTLDKGPSCAWINGLAGNGGSAIHSMVVLSTGEIAVLGRVTAAQIQVGTQTLKRPDRESLLFIARLDAQGKWGSWLQIIRSPASHLYGFQLAADHEDAVYVVGGFLRKVSFGSLLLESTTNFTTGFIAKVDKSGSWSWAHKVSSPDNPTQVADVVVDARNKAVTISAQTMHNPSFGKFQPKTTRDDLFGHVAQLSLDGAWSWVKSFRMDENSACCSSHLRPLLALTPKGEVVVAGHYRDDLSLGSFGLPAARGRYQMFVAALDARGQWLWATSGHSSTYVRVQAIDVDHKGQIAVAGHFDFGTFRAGLTTLDTDDTSNAFVGLLNPRGVWQELLSVGEWDQSPQVHGLGFELSGALTVAGLFEGELSLGSHSFPKSRGGQSFFLAQLSPQKSWSWAQVGGVLSISESRADGPGYPVSLRVLPLGDVFLAGSIMGNGFGSRKFSAPNDNGARGFVGKNLHH